MSESPVESTVLPGASNRFRYRLVHVVYIVTVLASSLATFGPDGLVPGVFACVSWAYVFTSRSRPRAFLNAAVVVLLCCCLIGLLLGSPNWAREAARRMGCANNLKQIGLALHNYHNQYRSFPPAYVADEHGNPLHSWRTLILPFLGEQALYDQYDFNEPWNGPHNRKLLDAIPSVYACPSSAHRTLGERAHSDYVVVVGSETAWPGREPGKLSGITDGAANTALVIELGGRQTAWLEPRDAEYDEVLDLLASDVAAVDGNHRHETFFYDCFRGRNVVFADGSVHFVYHGVDRNVWSALLGTQDEVVWDEDDLHSQSEPTKRLKVGNCLRLALFLALIVFPVPWVWRNPTSGKTRAPTADVEKQAMP